LESIPMSVRSVVEDAAKLFAVPAARKGLELICHIAPEVPESVLGDPSRLRQIVLNLIGNAIKFTDAGEIYVRVDCRERVENRCVLHCCVQDTGIGISPDKQQSIFEAFRQSDTSMTRRYGGTGLGLSISSQLVTLMGGRIWVESQQGRGSAFQFVIPLPLAIEPESDKSAAAIEKALTLRRAVLFARNAHARETYAAMLKGCGLNVAVVDQTDDAVSQCLPHAEEKTVADVLIVDISAAEPMELDQVEMLQHELHAAVPIVGIVAPAGQDDVTQRCQELGIEHCVTKPVKLQDLESALRAVLHGDNEIATPLSHAVQHSTASLRILVADDSPVNQEVAAGLLELQGHEVKTANSGRQALELWQQERFDLILMDVEMHDIDGLAATNAIRLQELKLARRTPIVAMTAHVAEGFKERCLAAGMDGYISKPFQPEELFHVIETLCVQTRRTGSAVS
jgi:CheY-like chemotaxis protein